MDSLQSLQLKVNLSVMDGNELLSLPEWSAALIWIGAWCRKHQFPCKRLITFAVLPTRDLASAFACIGSLLAGAKAFEDSLSWTRFSRLPAESKVFWCLLDGRKRYEGNVVGLEMDSGLEFMVVKVLNAPRRADRGSIFKISQRRFDDYKFSEEKPPSTSKIFSFKNAEQFISNLLGKINPNWIEADGAEGILITSMANFEKTLSGLSLKIDGQQLLPMRDLLCIELNGKQAHSKLRMSHPRGNLSGNFPLVILDGPDAFYIHEHLDNASNLLVILDRSEYREGIHNNVLQLKSNAEDFPKDYFHDIPDNFPSGIEFAAYVIDRG